jgi:tetratricopeptide (TPR) repeat protein
MPQAIPGDLDGLAALFRSLCTDRRLLVVLDNAADAEQVRPLLAAAPGTAVVVTTRAAIPGLTAREDAQRLLVRPLHADDAVDLLGRDLPGVAHSRLRRLAAACGNLPLALRLASSRLAPALPDVDLGGAVDELAASPARLITTLTDASDPYADLAAVFAWSLARTSPPESRAVLLLSASPSRIVDDFAAAALIGLPVGPARQLLSSLSARHLVERQQHGTWRLHDLVRAWAFEEAGRTLGPGQLRESARRALGYYFWTADAMDRILLPQRGRPRPSLSLPAPLSAPRLRDHAEALAWADETLPAIVEGMPVAEASGEYECVATLPHILLSYLNLRKPWPAWLALCRIGLQAAEKVHDPEVAANLHIAAGIAHRETHDIEAAVAALTDALEAFRRSGNAVGVAMTLNNLATIHQEAGFPLKARAALNQAAHELSETDDQYRRAIVMHNLAEAEVDLGELEDAFEHASAALAAAVQTGDQLGAATTRTTVGRIELRLGRPDVAETEFRAALAAQRAGGDRLGQATTQRYLGRLLLEAGRYSEAEGQLSEAVDILTDLHDAAAGVSAELLERARRAQASVVSDDRRRGLRRPKRRLDS